MTINKEAQHIWELACLAVQAYRLPSESYSESSNKLWSKLWRCDGMLSAYKNVLYEMGYSLQWQCDLTANAGEEIKGVRLVDPVSMTYIGME